MQSMYGIAVFRGAALRPRIAISRAVRSRGLTIMWVMCAVWSVAWSGCSSSEETFERTSRSRAGQLMVKMQPETYVIRQGDQVEISVWGYPEFSTTTPLPVRENGSIMLPLVGELPAAGHTKQDLSVSIKEKLSKYLKEEAEITVMVSSPERQKVSVFGAVTRQDNYAIPGEVTLMEALSSAGGASPESDLTHVRIYRNGSTDEPVTVDLTSYLDYGNLEAAPKVRPGDVVFVPKKENAVRSLSDFIRDAVLLLGMFRAFY